MSLTVRKPLGLLAIAGLVAVGVLIAAQSASATIARPNSATPLLASMTLAYAACTAPNGLPSGERHQPDNNFPKGSSANACAPPAVVTPRLTAGGLNGTAANFKGFVKLKVVPGDVQLENASPPNPQCKPFGFGPPVYCQSNWFQDVRCTAGYTAGTLGIPYSVGGPPPVCAEPGSANVKTNGNPSTEPDYGGAGAALNVIWRMRITDQANNGPSGGGCPTTCPDDATVEDLDFAIPFDCHITNSTAIGGVCQPRFASFNALCGCVANGKRSNIELGVGGSPYNGGIFATDGGANGQVPNLVPDTDTPMPYARQGLFIP